MSELREVHSYDGLTGESRRMSWGRSSWPNTTVVGSVGDVETLLHRISQARQALGEPYASRILNRILTKFADYGQQACICPDCPVCEESHSCVQWKEE